MSRQLKHATCGVRCAATDSKPRLRIAVVLDKKILEETLIESTAPLTAWFQIKESLADRVRLGWVSRCVAATQVALPPSYR